MLLLSYYNKITLINQVKGVVLMSKIVILGATGNYGGKAIEYLLERGVKPADIIAIYRNKEKAASLKEKGIEVRYGDYSQSSLDPEALKGADKLLFISGADPDNLNRIRHHLNVVEAARQSGIKHIVYTGIAYPQKSTFGMENVHVATECAIKAATIPYTFLRNTFYTEYFLVPQELQRAVDNKKLLSLAQGKKINFVSRNNMAMAAAVVLTTDGHENKTYEITAPQAYSYKDIADILTEVSGKKIEYVEVNSEQMTDFLTQAGVPADMQIWDSSTFQPGLVNGWAETTDSILADLIGANNITTPKQIIQEIFKQ